MCTDVVLPNAPQFWLTTQTGSFFSWNSLNLYRFTLIMIQIHGKGFSSAKPLQKLICISIFVNWYEIEY